MGRHAKALSATMTSFVVAMAVSLVTLAGAGPAQALTDGYAYSHSFGSQGSGNGQFSGELGAGVAIDQSNGDVYVTDLAYHRVVKFDSAGNFLQAWGWGVSDGAAHSEVCTAPSTCQEGLSGTGPGQFRFPSGIAVDNSGGVNDRDVYIADGGTGGGPVEHGAILKFGPNGNFLARIDGSETSGGVFADVPWNGAVSVDKSGFLWVAAGPVMKFGNDAENEFVPGSEWSQSGARSVTTNETGTRLVVNAGGEPDSPFLASPGGSKITGHLPCGGYFGGATAFDAKTGNFLIGNGGSVCVFTQKGAMVGQSFGSGVLGGVQGISANAATGNLYIEDGGHIAVFEPRIVPDVVTGDASGVGHTSATLTGQVAPDPVGGGDVSDCHFEIGTDTSYGTNIPCQPATPYASSTAVTAVAPGLNMETTYHYRLVAANSIDANPGADKTFTPRAVLGLSTDAASNVTPDSARLNAGFDPNGEDTSYYFEWGSDTSYGHTTSDPPTDNPGSTSSAKSVGVDIGGLSSFTKYHYRVVATNGVGTSYGEDRTLVTSPPAPPAIRETAASEVTDTGATLSTVVNPGFGETAYVFEYGDGFVGAYTNEVSADPLAPDDTDHPASIELTGLQPGSTYHFRVTAVSFGGTSHSPNLTFSTLAPPTVGSEGVSAVAETTATLGAVINPNRSATTYHFEYGTSAEYGSATRESGPIGADGIDHDVSAPLSGLKPGTTYHFRVVASNGVGKTADVDRVFTTAPPQVVVPAQESTTCKKGFVKRKGRCLKKQKRKQHHRSSRGRTRRSHG